MARADSEGVEVSLVGVEEIAGPARPSEHGVDEDVLASGDWAMFGRIRVPARGRDHDRLSWLRRLREIGDGLARRWHGFQPSRRRLVGFGAVAILVIGAGTAITLTRPSGSKAAAAIGSARPSPILKPQPTTTLPATRSTYDPDTDTTPALGPALAVPGGSVRAVGIVGQALIVVSANAISVVDSYSRAVQRQANVASVGGAQVLVDEVDGTLWDIDIGAPSGRAREFSLIDLNQTRSVAVVGTIYDAVMLGDQLYLATSAGIYAVNPGESEPTGVAATVPPAQALAADPDTDTVLALSSGSGARIVTISNRGNTVEAGPTINVSSPTIAVIRDALWVGGVGADARLERFDQSTLRPLPEGSGGVIVAEGIGSDLQASSGDVNPWAYQVASAPDLWVYAQAARQLYCVDSHSGLVLQRWGGVIAPVATGGSGPYVITASGVQPLVLRGDCTG